MVIIIDEWEEEDGGGEEEEEIISVWIHFLFFGLVCSFFDLVSENLLS